MRPTTAAPPGRPRTAGRSTSSCGPSTTRSTSTCGGATSLAHTRACGRSSRRATARRSRPRASTGSPSSRTASSGSAAASTRPTASWPATSSTRSSGERGRSGCPARRPSGGSSVRPIVRCWTGSSRRSAASTAIAAAHPEAAARLVARHGTEAPGVVALGGELDLLRPLVAGRPFLEAEVAWAVRRELALSVDDVLSRRLRLSPELADRGATGRAASRRDHGRRARLGRRAS